MVDRLLLMAFCEAINTPHAKPWKIIRRDGKAYRRTCNQLFETLNALEHYCFVNQEQLSDHIADIIYLPTGTSFFEK